MVFLFPIGFSSSCTGTEPPFSLAYNLIFVLHLIKGPVSFHTSAVFLGRLTQVSAADGVPVVFTAAPFDLLPVRATSRLLAQLHGVPALSRLIGPLLCEEMQQSVCLVSVSRSQTLASPIHLCRVNKDSLIST